MDEGEYLDMIYEPNMIDEPKYFRCIEKLRENFRRIIAKIKATKGGPERLQKMHENNEKHRIVKQTDYNTI